MYFPLVFIAVVSVFLFQSTEATTNDNVRQHLDRHRRDADLAIIDKMQELLTGDNPTEAYTFISNILKEEQEQQMQKCLRLLNRALCENRSADPFGIWLKKTAHQMTNSRSGSLRLKLVTELLNNAFRRTMNIPSN